VKRLVTALSFTLAALTALTACAAAQTADPATPAPSPEPTSTFSVELCCGNTPVPAPAGDTLVLDLAEGTTGNWVHDFYTEWRDMSWPSFYITPEAASLTVTLPEQFAAVMSGQEVTLILGNLASADSAGVSRLEFTATVTSGTVTFDFGGPLTGLGVIPERVRGSEDAMMLYIGKAVYGPSDTLTAYFQFDQEAVDSADLSGVPGYSHQEWEDDDYLYGVRWGQTIEIRLPEGVSFPEGGFEVDLSPFGGDSSECSVHWSPPGSGNTEVTLSDDDRVLSFPLPDTPCAEEHSKWILGVWPLWPAYDDPPFVRLTAYLSFE
jgi:hypothetical protein